MSETKPMTPWILLHSSHLKAARYDAEKKELWILFKNRCVYVYEKVPDVKWYSIVNANADYDTGAYFSLCIKGNFPWTKRLITPEDGAPV